MKHLGWKVLRCSKEYGRTSVFATTGALRYPVNKRVKPMPNCGPLTLFKTYDEAHHFLGFIGYRNQGEVVAVKYEPYDTINEERKYTLWQPKEGKSARGERLHNYVLPENTHLENRTEVVVRATVDLPKGTMLASAIMCLE